MTGPLIVGGGPAGCAAAIALARGGARPLMVERDEEVGDPLCGGFLSWRTAAHLAELGINCAELGAHRVGKLALFRREDKVEVALPAPAFGLSRHALDSALRARAIAEGTEIAFDTIRTLDAHTAIGTGRGWRGDAVFLACGKHDLRGHTRPRSNADPALGLRLRLPPSPLRYRLLAGRIELHLFAGGYAGIVLQEGGSANICLAVRKSLLASAGGRPRELVAMLAEGSGAFAARLGECWRSARIDSLGAVPYGWIARPAAPGMFRLGDQAAVIPSLAGEGIAIALASGTLAARAWFTGGPAASVRYQRAFAARAMLPVAAAGLAWHLAESRTGSRLVLAAARRLPALVRLAIELTRLPGGGSLALPQAAP